MDEDEALATDQDTSADGDWSQLDADDDNILGDFLFTKTGQNVAVCYDEDFHIGSVSSISSPRLAEVNFLRKCALVNNTYVWSGKPDKAAVRSLFAFDSDFDSVATTGGVWSVPSHEALSLKYTVYEQKYS